MRLSMSCFAFEGKYQKSLPDLNHANRMRPFCRVNDEGEGDDGRERMVMRDQERPKFTFRMVGRRLEAGKFVVVFSAKCLCCSANQKRALSPPKRKIADNDDRLRYTRHVGAME